MLLKLSALDGVVAQLVEHHNGIVGVRGSNPLGSTIHLRKFYRRPYEPNVAFELHPVRGCFPEHYQLTTLSSLAPMGVPSDFIPWTGSDSTLPSGPNDHTSTGF